MMSRFNAYIAKRPYMLLVGLLVFYMCVYFPKLDAVPMVLYDESPYANTAFEYAKTGAFENTLGGLSGQQLFLYPYVLSQWIGAAGLMDGRLVSAALGMLSVALLFLICRRTRASYRTTLLAGIAFIVANVNIVAFRIIRPEVVHIPLLLCLVWLFLYIEDYPSKRRGYIGFGVICSLLSLNHFIGFLVAVSLCSVLCISWIKSRQWRPFMYIAIGTLPVVAWWGSEVIQQYGSLHAFITFVQGSGKFSSETGYWALFKINFIDGGWHRYSMGIKRLPIILFELVIVAIGMRSTDRRINAVAIALCLYLGAGFLMLNLFLRSYFITVPALVIIITVLIMTHSKLSQLKNLVGVCFAAYIAYNVAGDSLFFYNNRHNTSFTQIERRLSEHISDPTLPIVGYHEFWFATTIHPFVRSLNHDDISRFTEKWPSFYVIVTPFKLSQKSLVSMDETVISHDPFYRFYTVQKELLKQNATQLTVLKNTSYGDIELWRVEL